jgi:tetratricopeptide (TPR) repeat protein
MPVPSPNALSGQFATAYFEAAQAGADMRNVANVLETLRSHLAQAKDPYEVWAALGDQIGSADLDRFVPALVKLAEAFQSAVIDGDVAELHKAFAKDREHGWSRWLDAYARSFDAAGWRPFYAAAIAQGALVYSPYPDWTVERIREAVLAVKDGRWAETYDWFLFLAERELPIEYRARFFAVAAEIQIFHFFQLTKAKTYLQKADELAADVLQNRNAWGEYWVALGQWDEARKVFGEIVKAYPERAEGYVGMGDCDDKTGQLASAERWYYQALQNAPGGLSGYGRLASLWLRPDLRKEPADPAQLESLIQPLLRRWKALCARPAEASVGLGVAYKTRKWFDQAQRYFEEAIQSDPSYALPHVWLGYTYLDEADQMEKNSPTGDRLYASARDHFNIAIQLAPRTLDGYWAISSLYMQQQKWPDAEEWTNRCLPLHPEWESFVRARRAEILRRQGRFADAEKDVLRSLDLESVNESALGVMSALVDDYWKSNQKDDARQLLEQWKEKSATNQAYLYYNRLGNWSYEAGDYSSAVESYRRAIGIKEADPVLHSNLASALQRLRVPGERLEELTEAIAELERANELVPQQDQGGQIAALRLERAFLKSYGEAAAAFVPVVDPIRVDIDWAIMKEILAGTNLTPETKAGVSEVRTRLKQEFGFVLPGVNFRDIQPPGSGTYRITFNESTTYEGFVKAGSVLGTVLARLEDVVQSRMAELLGHDGVAAMLKQMEAPSAAAIVQNVAQLTHFVGLLRGRLARRQSIEPLAVISEEFERATGGNGPPRTKLADELGGATSSLGSGFPQLVVRIGHTDPAVVLALQSEVQKTLFNELGVPVPRLACEPDASLAGDTAVLLLNGVQASTIENMSVEAFRSSLQDHAPDLIVPDVTATYLAKIKDRYPVLIRAVEAQLGIEEITAFLRRRLLKRQSIKNFPGLLEDQLQESQVTVA